MNRKKAAIVGMLVGINMLAGCAKTPETPVIRPKGEGVGQHAGEAGNLIELSEKTEAGSTVSGILLRTRLGAPGHYQSVVSDATGKLNVFTDAVVEIPEVEDVPAIYVERHVSGQEDIDAITLALFGNTDVYEADTDGNCVYGSPGETETAQTTDGTMPENRRLLDVPYEFQEEPIDPWMPEAGSVYKVYGYVRAEDGNGYRYQLTKRNNRALSVWAKKADGDCGAAEGTYYIWSEYDAMKLLYSWVPDESSINPGITEEEARKLADEKAAAFGLQDMQVASSGIVLEIRCGNGNIPQEKDMTNIGYVFHYTRRPAGIPITYTVIPGGGKESGMGNETVPWAYESLDIYVTRDGIEEVYFANQYDIKERKAESLELLPFSDIIAIYEKMMLIRNGDALKDMRAEGEDIGEPLQAKNFYVNKIVLGYTRIYDPQSDDDTGILVPVWDFFGTYELSYDGEDVIAVNDVDKSFLTINALDGTLVDRWLGY